MKKQRYFSFIFWVVAIGVLSGFLSRNGMQEYAHTAVQPPAAPPGFLFPLVWFILYALMGIGAARIWAKEESTVQYRAMNIFVVQLIVNFFWSLIFFNARAFGAAFLWLIGLWVLIIAMILWFSKVDRTASLLQIPYLIWTSFAGYLNYTVWQLNP